MAFYGLILKNVEDSIDKNKHLEDLRNRNKALQAQLDKLNKAHTSAFSELSKLLEEKKNLEATLSNQKESMHAVTSSLASAEEEVQNKDEEITALWDACIDKFVDGVKSYEGKSF